MKFTSSAAAVLAISAASSVLAAPAPFHHIPKFSVKSISSTTETTSIHQTLTSYIEQPSIIVDDESAPETTTVQSSTSSVTSVATHTSVLSSPEIIMTIESFAPIIIKPYKTVPLITTSSTSVQSSSSASSSVEPVVLPFHLGHGPAIVSHVSSSTVSTATLSPAAQTTHASTVISQTISSSTSKTSSTPTALAVQTNHTLHFAPIPSQSSSTSIRTTMSTQTIKKTTSSTNVNERTTTTSSSQTQEATKATKTVHQYVTISLVRDTAVATPY